MRRPPPPTPGGPIDMTGRGESGTLRSSRLYESPKYGVKYLLSWKFAAFQYQFPIKWDCGCCLALWEQDIDSAREDDNQGRT